MFSSRTVLVLLAITGEDTDRDLLRTWEEHGLDNERARPTERAKVEAICWTVKEFCAKSNGPLTFRDG